MTSQHRYPSIARVLEEGSICVDHLPEKEIERYYTAIVNVIYSMPDEEWCKEVWDDAGDMTDDMRLADWVDGAGEDRKKMLIAAFEAEYPGGFV